MEATSVVHILPSGSIFERAETCRSAALGFMAYAPTWNKRELATWLERSYAPAVVGVANAASDGPRRVDTGRLSTIVENAHAGVAARLRDVSQGRFLPFVRHAMKNRLVRTSIDDLGNTGWVPLASSRMLLADRVLSLFAADFLVRPWDYEHSLFVCSCNKVRFVDVPCGCDVMAKVA